MSKEIEVEVEVTAYVEDATGNYAMMKKKILSNSHLYVGDKPVPEDAGKIVLVVSNYSFILEKISLLNYAEFRAKVARMVINGWKISKFRAGANNFGVWDHVETPLGVGKVVSIGNLCNEWQVPHVLVEYDYSYTVEHPYIKVIPVSEDCGFSFDELSNTLVKLRHGATEKIEAEAVTEEFYGNYHIEYLTTEEAHVLELKLRELRYARNKQEINDDLRALAIRMKLHAALAIIP